MNIRSLMGMMFVSALAVAALGTDLGRWRAWAPRHRERHQEDGHTRRRVTHALMKRALFIAACRALIIPEHSDLDLSDTDLARRRVQRSSRWETAQLR